MEAGEQCAIWIYPAEEHTSTLLSIYLWVWEVTGETTYPI